MKNSIMKMWTSVVTITVIAPVTVLSHSFYLSASSGYAFMYAGMNSYNAFLVDHIIDETGSYYETKNFSLAEGLNFGVDFGYRITKHIASEIGFSYLSGNAFEFVQKDKKTIHDERAISATMYRISPTIIISTGNTLLAPYMKFGVVFGIGNIHLKSKTGNTEKDLKMRGGIPIGITGALGIEYIINDNFSCFAQISTVNMNYFPEKGEITKWTENGIDVLPEKSFREKNITYKNKYYLKQEDQNADPNKPRDNTGMSYPFGNFGINIGLKVKISDFSFKLKQDNPK